MALHLPNIFHQESTSPFYLIVVVDVRIFIGYHPLVRYRS